MRKISTFLALAFLSAFSVFADTKVVFLNDNGNNDNDGATPETAIKSLTKAYELIPTDTDGVIVVNGKFTQAANFAPTAPRTGTITYTQVYDGTDYRAANHDETAWTLTKGMRLGITSDTRFENITFNLTGASGYLLLIANYHEVTIGQGCEMHGNFTWNALAQSFTVLGGCQDNDNLAAEGMNPKINVESGDVYLVLYNRGTAKNFKNNAAVASSTATVNIKGGRVHNLYAGSVSSGLKGGGSEINISGGEFVGRAFLGTSGANSVDGKKVAVNISGGKFPAVRVFNVSEPHNNPDTEFEMSVHGLAPADQYTLLHYTMTMDFDRVEADILVPEKVFKEGRYTLADGTDMNYRYYEPEGKSGERHLVLYLHDLGSRGDDNKLHMCSMGASPLYQILNSGENVIIVGAQLPKEEQWVTGRGGYQEESEATKWLDGAVALAMKFAEENGVPKENMSLVGSSNGAAAIWHLVNSEEPLFARAAPIAGYGDAGGKFDALVANAPKSDIWAFHGSDDSTVPAEGMKTLAPALEKVSDRFRYTEYEGATHATIYSLAANTPGFTDFFFKKQTTGIANMENERELEVTVNGSVVEVRATGEVGVYDLAGMKIAEGFGTEGTVTFESLAKGIYIVCGAGKSAKAYVR